MKKPIQLIKFDSKKNVQLTQQAIDIFSKLQSKQLCIVCVAGKYRTGKSYILNRVILQQNNGFEVGPTINACTKGLWMWPQIVKIDYCGHVKQCLIIDTQGLGSLQQGQNTDLKIFLLAMLLSSYLIYNSVSSIDQKALQSLNLVINMAQLLQKSTNSYDSQQLINTFPQFMWLVRDFSLRLENQNGQVITSRQYLQTALSQKKGKTPAAQRKNAIRKQLKTFFKQRDCFTLIRPTLNEKDLQNLSTLSQKRLRPQFLTLINQLKVRIHQSIQPKKLRGKSITPSGFIQLCHSYIKSINSGKLPTISSSWDNLCMSESSRVIKKYEMRLKEYVSGKEILGEQVEAGELTERGQKLLQQAKQTVDKSFLGKLQKKLLKQKLQKTMKQTISEIFNNNYISIEQKVQKKIKQLFDEQLMMQNKEEHEQDDHKENQNDNKRTRQYNFYYKIDTIKQKFVRFEQLINKNGLQKESNNKKTIINSTNKREIEFTKRVYRQFMHHIEQKIFKVIEQQMYTMANQNKQMREKLVRVEQRSEVSLKQDRIIVMRFKNELEDKQRQMRKCQMINKKLQQQIQKVKQQNATKNIEIEKLNIKLQQQQKSIQHQLSLLQKQSQTILKQQQTKYQQQMQQLTLIYQTQKQQLHELQIKQRKINRQCDIYKQKFIQKQKQLQTINKQIQQFKQQLMSLQRQKRILMRKVSSNSNNHKNCSHLKNDISKFSMSMSSIEIKSLLKSVNQQQQTSPKVQNHSLTVQQQQNQSQTNTNSQNQQQQLNQQLINKINQLQILTQRLNSQLKQKTMLYNQQKSINNLLINTPQSINYQSLKKNYLQQKKYNHILNKKLKLYQTTLNYVNKMQCCLCGQLVGKNSILNSNIINGHYMKCIANKIGEIEFDVSYVYDQQGELRFLFQIKMETISENDSFSRFVQCNNQYKRQIQWQVTKSLKSIRLLLKLMKKDNTQIILFNQNIQNQNIIHHKQQFNTQSTSKSTKLSITQNIAQQKINLNEQRRLYLDQECHKMKFNIKKNNLIIEFFNIDIHLLRQTKIQKKISSTPLSFNNTLRGSSTIKTSGRKSMLYLDLGQITQEKNENDNCDSVNNGRNSNFNMRVNEKKLLSQSLNLMKTTKFSTKKVFKFINNV